MKSGKLLAGLCLIAFMLGCITTTGGQKISGEKAAAKKRALQNLANNIPLYPNFKYRPDDSFFFESGGVKAGVMVFEGKAQVGEVVNFYKREMPSHGWSMVSSYQYGKEALLDFSAPEKTCQISVQAKPFNSLLVIRTGTRVAGPKEPEELVK
jgi:hypothetical protein